MRIGELCNKTDLSRDTIRCYERKGLIKSEDSISLYNNYKEYSDAVFRRLTLIKKAKTFGFTLNKIADQLKLVDQNLANCGIVSSKVEAEIKAIDQKILELLQPKQLILGRMSEALKICETQSNEKICSMVNLT